MEVPDTQYAWNGDAALAYQILGDGPIDLLYMDGDASHLDLNWASHQYARFLRGLAHRTRLIVSDRRGCGLSERYEPGHLPPMESTTDDALAVLDAAGSDRAVLFLTGWWGLVATFLAAAHPERVSGIVYLEFSPALTATEETPWETTADEWERLIAETRDTWGTRRWLTVHDPGTTDPREREWFWRWTGASCAPGAYHAERSWLDTDVRSLLPSIQAPTLVLANRAQGQEKHGSTGRYVADHITGAELAEYDGGDSLHWYEGADQIVSEIGRFLAKVGDEESSFDRTLATVLFTDIVDSTSQSAALGDRKWREVRERHDQVVRSQIARYRGREIKTMGDGFLATFDGPARGVKAATAIAAGVRPLGIEIRAGLHTGEVELDGDDVAGLAVAIGARVGAKAGPSEVLVSQTIKDLVAGSGLTFEDAGEHELKGVPDRWHLYRVADLAR